MLQYLRANALAASALAVALAGTSIAIVGLPHNSVGSKQIRKAGVHKSDIHAQAITSSKIRTGVLRMDGFALSSNINATPSNSTDSLLLQRPFTTKTTGRIFGLGRGSFAVTCTSGSVRLGLYLDQTIPLVSSGVPLSSSPSFSQVNVFGVTASSVPPGVHVISVGADCLTGSVTTSSAGSDAAVGAIVLRN